MGVLDAFGSLASSLIAAAVMLIFAILSLFVTVFIVDVAAAIGGLNPDDGFVVLGAAIIAAAAIGAAGGFATPEQEQTRVEE